MINLELTPQTAIAVLDLICREEKLYGQEAVPSRIVDLRALLADIDKVIIDKNSGSGVVPYLPLPELKKKDPK